MHWQQNRLGPLGIIVLLHASLFFALRSNIPQAAAPAGPKTLFATFITPERPAVVTLPAPQLTPPKPRKAPTPHKTVAASKPVPAPVAAPAPHAISAPPQPPAAADTPTVAQEASAAAAPAAAAQPVPAQPKTISIGVEYLQQPQPRYPPLSRRMGEEGRAILRVLVNARGMPERSEIRTSSGSARLDEAAREAVMRAQFRPHIDNGQAVAVFVIVPIRFQLDT
ncbi:MAG: energy transducer TonB [Oxalobacteraceae bacterium]|nr:energy transducer TonB [Oxalobacteraceae bacterium]